MKREDQRYQQIVDLWKAGHGYGYIASAVRVSNATIKTIVDAEGLPVHTVGPRPKPLVSPSADQNLYNRQNGRCAFCEEKLPTGVLNTLVPSPANSLAVAIVCPPCGKIMNALIHDWRGKGTIVRNMAAYWQTFAEQAEIPVATGNGHYLTATGAEVYQYKSGRYAILRGLDYIAIGKECVVWT